MSQLINGSMRVIDNAITDPIDWQAIVVALLDQVEVLETSLIGEFSHSIEDDGRVLEMECREIRVRLGLPPKTENPNPQETPDAR